MIVFDLRCRDGGELFEGWFSSSADFAEQLDRGLVQCPFCSSANVEKAPMAPRVRRSAGEEESLLSKLEKLASLQKKLLDGSEYVGDKLPEQARAMHLGEIEPKAVHGEASADEARALVEEGVPIVPLPLPVRPPRQVN